jgi:predicted transcriptional regulator
MTPSPIPVSVLMNSPVASVSPETTLDVAYRRLVERRISSVPVVDADGCPLGVLSDTDLLHVGRLEPAALAGIRLLDLPPEPALRHMHAGVVTVPPDMSVKQAAATLVDRQIHRVFVAEGATLIGVFGTDEVLMALREKRMATPIEDVMSRPVETISLRAPLDEAARRLDRAHRRGLVVVDDLEHPIGALTKTDVLWARGWTPDTMVEEAMSYSMMALNAKTPVFRAAAHSYETRARMLIVMDGRKVGGMLTGLDFARVLAASD